MNVEPGLIFGLLTGLGAAFRGVLSFWNLKKDNPKLAWDWVVFASEAVPAFAVGFLAGAINTADLNVVNCVAAFFGGAGIGSLQAKVGQTFQ